MWRSGGGNRGGAGKKDTGGLVVIAVDADKNSQHALKWAADHLLAKGQIFHLLHVRKKITKLTTPVGQQLNLAEVNEDIAATFLHQLDMQTKETLLPFQCFCSRRGLYCKEVILDEVDIPKAIIDYLIYQSADKLVLGASSRSAFARTFKQADVPTSVSKLAPDFCSIYVIAKGKISSIRPALRPNKNAVGQPSRPIAEATGNPYQSAKTDPGVRQPTETLTNSNSPSASHSEIPGESQSPHAGHLDFSYQSVSSCPSPSRNSIHRPFGYPLRGRPDGGSRLSKMKNARDKDLDHDEQRRSYEVRRPNDSNLSSTSGVDMSGISGLQHSSPAFKEEELDDELRKLKLEVKQTMDIYNNACVDAVNAGRKARDSYARMPDERGSEELGLGVAHEEDRETSGGPNMDKVLLQENMKVLDALSTNAKYRRYTVEEITKATDEFSDALKIGEGGYGPVFKSNLDHTLVAIKVLRSDVQQGMKQFQQEVEVLSTIRHPNMVLLLGACPEYGCLVYEYMSNGSLEDCLFRRNNTPPLSWQLRFKIAAEITTGLLYLHQNKPDPLVHRDLKPANILLNHNFVSKIADVGLARLIPPSAADAVTQYRMTAAAGTFCYIDPEYQKTGMLGIKSDIYALGIIFLQLVTGKPPMGLAHNVERAIESGKFKAMLDPSVLDWPMEETVRFCKLALRCAELRRKDRPDLGTVVLPELNRLKELAEEAQPNAKQFQHAKTWRRQDVVGVSSGPDSGVSAVSDLEKAYPASMIVAPTNGGSFLS